MKSHLDVYARIKPCSGKYGQFSYKIDEKGKSLEITMTKASKYGYMHNAKDSMMFTFTQVLDQNANQGEVFDLVAKPVVLNCLEGYNGTIFAYGQTGSGKTFTMSGAGFFSIFDESEMKILRIMAFKRNYTESSERNFDFQRLILRKIPKKFVFDEIERRKKVDFRIYVSFLEIYNEQAYDLLDKKHVDLPIESWNKTVIFEDDYGNTNFKNLTLQPCSNEQEGIDLLMTGNFIRQVSSTAMNQCSSRSHCVFTITIEGKIKNSEFGFVSKLHLVDLAGSERVSKTQVEGSTLNEAKHINLSLSYLEQVILALHERSQGNRTHVPYRNSLMTTVLKDSLGGNCKTVMVATISSDAENLDETISTARFAQRCSQLENEISKNEKVDLNALVLRLEKEKEELSKQVAFYQTIIDGNPEYSKAAAKFADKKLENYDYNQITTDCENFLNDSVPNMEIKSVSEATLCFHAMKDIYNNRMREYVSELNYISNKLEKYDEILSKKKMERRKEPFSGSISSMVNSREELISQKGNNTNNKTLKDYEKK